MNVLPKSLDDKSRAQVIQSHFTESPEKCQDKSSVEAPGKVQIKRSSVSDFCPRAIQSSAIDLPKKDQVMVNTTSVTRHKTRMSTGSRMENCSFMVPLTVNTTSNFTVAYGSRRTVGKVLSPPKSPNIDSELPKTPEAWAKALNRRTTSIHQPTTPTGTATGTGTNLYLDVRSRLKHVQQRPAVCHLSPAVTGDESSCHTAVVQLRSHVPQPLSLTAQQPQQCAKSPTSPDSTSTTTTPPFMLEWQQRRSLCMSPGLRQAPRTPLPMPDHNEPEFTKKAKLLVAKHRQQSIET
jgi:hypothetical protein